MLYIALPPRHTTYLYANRPTTLSVDIYLVRLHRFETISTHLISVKVLRQRSAVQIDFFYQGRIAVFLPPHQVLFMHPTKTGHSSTPHIENLLHFVFISIQFDLQLSSGHGDSSESTRYPLSTTNPLSGRSGNFTTHFNLKTCTTENNRYGFPAISKRTA